MNKIRLALCLSGGGFRASLFHLGVLRRLHELKLLPQVRLISAVSGGAVTAALLSSSLSKYHFSRSSDEYDYESFHKSMINIVSRGVMRHFYASLLMYMAILLASISYIMGFFAVSSTFVFISLFFYFYLLHAANRAQRSLRDYEVRMSSVTGEGEHRWFTGSATWLPFSPSEMRVVTLILDVFGGEQLRDFSTSPRICISAVDLISGKQKVFTSGVLAELSQTGASAIWESRLGDGEIEGEGILMEDHEPKFAAFSDVRSLSVARAVAASTAFPPVFNFVSVRRDDLYLGSFVDGGVLDNLGINPLIQLADSISSERNQRYDPEVAQHATFIEAIDHVLVVDAGRTARRRHLIYLFRPAAIQRIINVMLGHQGAEADRKRKLLHAFSGLPVSFIGLVGGLPPGDDLDDDQWKTVLPRLRTHLDGFSSLERATLIYAGYK